MLQFPVPADLGLQLEKSNFTFNVLKRKKKITFRTTLYYLEEHYELLIHLSVQTIFSPTKLKIL